MKNNRIFLLAILLIPIWSCADEAKLGKLHVKGCEGIYFDLYQEREFDSATALYYQLVQEDGISITPKKYLHGTDTYEINTDNFYAECLDGIVFLCFHSKNVVSALYDLKTNTGHPHLVGDWKDSYVIADQLMLELKKTKPELRGRWN